MMDVDPPFPIQEEGTFIDRSKHVAHKQGLEQEDAENAEAMVSPPSTVKTEFPNSQVDLEDKKRWKRRKRRKKKQKKTVQTPSTVTKSECKDYFWTAAVISCAVLAVGTAASSVQKPSVEETPEIPDHRPVIKRSVEEEPKILDHRSEDPKYESISGVMCAATFAVGDPPIVLMLDGKRADLNTSVRCPHAEEHFGIKTCLKNDYFLKVVFKKGQAGSLFIEHGRGRDQRTPIDMNNHACYSSVEDQTSNPEEAENDEANKERTPSAKDRLETEGQNVTDGSSLTDAGGLRFVGGIGALFLIIFLAAAFIFVAKDCRAREQQFSRLLEQPSA